ncbi:MAG: glycine cleavage system aminomethyltransferase GcvT [Planctomycetota bacterium]
MATTADSAQPSLAPTPLHEWHASHGGRMVDFAGWSMPVQYGSIIEEHNATRTAVGVFDVSHMGRLLVEGADAAAFLDSLTTRRVANLKPGQVRYSLVCNESGGVLDDVLVYRFVLPGGEDDPPTFGLVVNASNRETIVAWFHRHTAGKDVTVTDNTLDHAMIAVQGPKAIELLDPITGGELTTLRYYTGMWTTFTGCDGGPIPCFFSRTGYTGEDGGELIVPAEHAAAVWERVVGDAKEVGGGAVGLAARDTLRLEAGMPLYGHELSEAINPLQAGLGFAVNLKGREFVGKDALAAASEDPRQPVRIGLQLEGKRAPREGYPVLQGPVGEGAVEGADAFEEVGVVTSGTFSPTLGRPIAMALVKPSAAAVGERLAVDARGTELPATVTPLPFYERGK